MDDVVLLTSEVVTNAVLHGGPHGIDGEVVLWLDITASTVRVEVHDHNLASPTVGDAPGTGLSRRGMVVLDRLASAWGSQPTFWASGSGSRSMSDRTPPIRSAVDTPEPRWA